MDETANRAGSYVGKMRNWQANVSVAASGPAFVAGKRHDDPIGIYPKTAAELQYTSADIAFLSSHWREAQYRAPVQFHTAKYDCDYASVTASLAEAGGFLVDGARSPDFDGGSLLFAYSGHGREGDGTLCLNDATFLSAEDFVNACLSIQSAAPGRGRLRLELLLDSCHSGAFLLRVLEMVLHKHPDKLVPDYFFASSMPDEYSFEIPVLGHGLATFCFSVKPLTLGSMVASADRMPVTWAVAAGARGCSIVSGGQQNPMVYDNYELEVANQSIPVWSGEPVEAPRPRSEWEADIFRLRDEVVQAVGRLGGFGMNIEARRRS